MNKYKEKLSDWLQKDHAVKYEHRNNMKDTIYYLVIRKVSESLHNRTERVKHWNIEARELKMEFYK